jgi:hypothetical protein
MFVTLEDVIEASQHAGMSFGALALPPSRSHVMGLEKLAGGVHHERVLASGRRLGLVTSHIGNGRTMSILVAPMPA